MDGLNTTKIIELTANIVSAFVSNNPLHGADLPELIATVHASLNNSIAPKPALEAEKRDPAVPISKSITADYIVCLENGKKFKSLKRHLRSAYDMSPEEYRAKWGLSYDYPMVAPGYATARSDLARKMGLGRKAAAAPEATAANGPAMAAKRSTTKRGKGEAAADAEPVPIAKRTKRAAKKAAV